MGSDPKTPDLETKIAAIVERYRKDLPLRIAELQESWVQIFEAREPREALQRLFHGVHTLKGSAATLGFADVSVEAARIGAGLRLLLQQSRLPDAAERSQLEAALDRLAVVISDWQACAGPATDPLTVSRPAAADYLSCVMLVQGRSEVDHVLVAQLEHFGFETVRLRYTEALAERCAEYKPAAVVIDIDAEQGNIGFVAGRDLTAALPAPPPVIYLGSRADIESRLQAVRSGGAAYLRKPVSVADLLDILDRVANGERAEPYRVLIVEDSEVLSALYSVTLEDGGMRTMAIRDPLQLLDAMKDFNPELVLMDMYLPGYTGAELAALIRQDSSYVGVPIVYLSSETDLHTQLQAMSQGGDDFLTKPITPAHLVSAVRTRTERYRALGRLMARDSLTGLLNHSRTKEQLDIAFQRAQRQNSALAFAVLDIDNFKAVNDAHGHGVGDRVIQSLARLLRQRLRATDVVGRYGGEEFAVVLENLDCEGALRILDDLRMRFGALLHQAGGRECQVTISCGVACYPRYGNVNQLSEAAEQALYRAKRNGRNQVQVGG